MKKAEFSRVQWNRNSCEQLLMYLLEELGGGQSKNRDYVANLMTWLSTTPRYTVYRVNTLIHKSEEIKDIIYSHLSKQALMHGKTLPSVNVHSLLNEVIVLDSRNVNSLNLNYQEKEVIVDLACGTAVLRGAHVFAPGVKGICSGTIPGDYVSVYADVETKCTRGLMTSFTQSKYFIGNGIVRIGRNDLFGRNASIKGIAVEMTDIVSGVPSLPPNSIPNSKAILQNLPSVLSCKTLNPQPGEIILDMCAAPGNKTTHMAMLMNDMGMLIAVDKTNTKVNLIRERCQQFNINCVKCFVYDSTKAVKELEQTVCAQTSKDITQIDGAKDDRMYGEELVTEGPPFPCKSFDKILLDAPCSALGQRPQISNTISLKQLKSYPPLQKKLFQTAVKLLKTGGHIVYSTCTITVAENENLVKWALEKFPCLDLVPIEPALGGPGLENVGLTEEQQQCVRRFGPPISCLELYFKNYDYNQDTVGFFIAHFVKRGEDNRA